MRFLTICRCSSAVDVHRQESLHNGSETLNAAIEQEAEKSRAANSDHQRTHDLPTH